MQRVGATALAVTLDLMPTGLQADGRKPCDRGDGGISHCQGDRFVCNNGTIRRSTKICDPALLGQAPPPRADPRQGDGFTCLGKRRCGDMASCAEARHYLTNCAVRSLDRDGDGVTCKTMCR